MNKAEAKKLAIEEISDLMDKYTKYVQSVKDQPFDAGIREQLKTKSDIIRMLLLGLESGYYET
ncbi:MAG: hypothetical protein K8U57_28360 [Planctomycetes bacterium]|nr:hypothetical protein [Planctomycetota bacterium]